MGNNISWEANKWTGSTFNWLDTTGSGPVAGLVAKIDAWVSTVNGNASNATKQITKLKDNSNSGGTQNGFVYRFATNTSTYAYLGYWNTSTTNRAVYFGSTYTDNGTNDGLGTISGNGIQDTSLSFLTAPTNWDTAVISSTVNGQEFINILHSNGGGSNIYEDGVLIFKDNDGDWAVATCDSTTIFVGCYIDDAQSTGWQALNRQTGMSTLGISAVNGATGTNTILNTSVTALVGTIVFQYINDANYSSTQDTTPTDYKYFKQPANPYILYGGNTLFRYGYRLILNVADSSNRIFITPGTYNQWGILIDGTP